MRDHTRFWTDYVAPFTYAEIDDIFDTGGRGLWADLDPIYAARKSQAFPGKDILRRDDTYFKAATTPSHPNSFLEVSPTELVLGVSGLGYPAFHEEGAENLSARPVYELIAAGAAFEERISQLGEKWQREESRLRKGGFKMKILIVLTITALFMVGCEVTPYRHIITTDAGEEIGLRCALVGGIPVACAFFHETKIEVPFKVLVEVVVEKVVEVEKIKIVEVETIVEIMTTKYIDNNINVADFVQSVISALPVGTTRQNYSYPEVVSAVEETLVTYTPPPTQTTQVTTVREPTDTDVPVSAPVERSE